MTRLARFARQMSGGRLAAALALLLAASLLFACGGPSVHSSSSASPSPDPRDAIVGRHIARINAWLIEYANGVAMYSKGDLQDVRRYHRSTWPTNPFTGKPMAPGTGPGDYTFAPTHWDAVGETFTSYLLAGFGAGGKPVVRIDGWASSERSLETALQAIAAAAHAWANDHGGRVPEPRFVTEAGLGSLAQYMHGDWPTNPLSGQPIAPGPVPGDYQYTRSSDGTRCTLVASLVDWTDPADGWTVTAH
jgi:hypothetical protein